MYEKCTATPGEDCTDVVRIEIAFCPPAKGKISNYHSYHILPYCVRSMGARAAVVVMKIRKFKSILYIMYFTLRATEVPRGYSIESQKVLKNVARARPEKPLEQRPGRARATFFGTFEASYYCPRGSFARARSIIVLHRCR